MMYRLLALMLALGMALCCAAQDMDNDGIPDAVEYRLGANPRQAEAFSLLHHDGEAGADDRSLSRSFADAPDFLDVLLANVAGDRWLFKVVFARDYVPDPNTFILYLDVDLDETTGRQDAAANRGTDLMYTQANGGYRLTEHTPSLRTDPLRMEYVGAVMYICADIPLEQDKAGGKVRFKVLSHVSPPQATDSDFMDWVVADLPEAGTGRKPRIGPPPQMPPLSQLTTQRADLDGDGIPDDVELGLGMNPKVPEQLHLIHDDGAKGQGDTSINAKHEIAPDVTQIHFGSVAGDRYVWRLDFAQAFEPAGTVLILYLDADNRKDTGRTGFAEGVDVMLTCVDGAISPAVHYGGVLSTDARLRGQVDGRSVWLSMDLQIYQDPEGRSEYRGFVLCHKRPETSDADSTPWFDIYGPGESAKPKPRVGMVSEYKSEGMRVHDPWLGWREDLEALAVTHLRADEAALDGMATLDRALEPQRPGATAEYEAPGNGVAYPCVVLQDGAVGDEAVTLELDGKRLARMVAAQNDGLCHLYVCEQPVQLAQGQKLRLTAEQSAQDFRISEVFLAKAPPEPRPLQITDIATYCSPLQQGDRVDVDICWRTNLPVPGIVTWGADGALEATVQEPVRATHSHRIRLEGLERGKTYQAQIRAGERADAPRSEVLSFVADRRRIAAGTAVRESVALQVTDGLGEARGPWPVSGGVPFAQGALASASHCRLTDLSGTTVPASFTELAWWPDGSVKWVLVSATCQSDGQYRLEYGTALGGAPQGQAAVTVEEIAQGLRVRNGPLQVELSRERFALPGAVWMDGDNDGAFEPEEAVVEGDQPGIIAEDPDGRRYASVNRPLEALVVEESGPTRVVVRAEGRLRSEDGGELFRFRCRLYFSAGFSGIPVTLNIINDLGANAMPPTMTSVRSVTLPVRVGGAGAEPVRVLQDYDSHTVLTRAEAVSEQDGRPVGAIALSGERGVLTACIRDFWQKYPKALATDGDTVTLELFPRLPESQYAQHTDPKLRTQHYYWLKDGQYQVPCGVAPGNDLLFHFGDGSESAESLGRKWQAPVLLAAEPVRYCASGALMDLQPQIGGQFDAFSRYTDTGLKRIDQARERVREYDWMNHGDWYGERAVNWGNQEYDLQWGLAVQFARSGDLRFFDRALQAAVHMGEIDVINASPRPEQIGRAHIHGLGHTGGFEMERVPGTEYWFTEGGHDIGHTWSQGSYTMYCLTGDRRLLDCIASVPEWLAGNWTVSEQQHIHRNCGWATLAVLGGYSVTADPFYLNAARFYCDQMVSKQDPGTGSWLHPIGECTHRPYHMGGKVFMSGVNMTALRMLDDLEPRPSLKSAITRNCDWMWARMWHPDDNSFQYAQCTDFDRSSTHAGTYMSCEGLAYAYDLTQDGRYREMLERSLGDMLQRGPGSEGKSYAMQIRMVPYALAAMGRWGMTEVPLPPPAPPRVTVGSTVYTIPGADACLSIRVDNRGGAALPCSARVLDAPDGVSATAPEVTWAAPPGSNLGPALVLRIAGEAEGTVRVGYQAGDQKGEAQVSLRPAQTVAIGTGLGYIGGEGAPLKPALEAIGVTLPQVSDLSAETLRGYGALIIGAEALGKGFAGLDRDWANLLDFAYSGGRVCLLQLQDTTHESGHLHHPLGAAEENSSCGAIAVPEHPLFTHPNRVTSLAGAIAYDTLTYAGEGWAVLARDQKGGPGIVEGRVGRGRILVVQPSVDRYVAGTVQPEGSLDVQQCRNFTLNLVAYLRGA